MRAPIRSISGLPLGETRFVRASGAYCWDEANNAHVDFASGFGSVILGHAHPAVTEQVIKAAQGGNYLYGQYADVERLRDRLLAFYPDSTHASLFKTGSEAVQAAVRLARATTGKTRILRCGFHGWHDQFMHDDISWHRYALDVAERDHVAGIPEIMSALTTPVACDPEAVAAAVQQYRDVAALILDPVQLREPLGDTLRGLREACDASGILFIIDEAKTGVRLSRGGVQGLYRIYGDITVLSKAIANGYALSAVVHGKRVDRSQTVKLMGTFNHERTAVAASLATLDAIEQCDGWARLEATGLRLIERVNRRIADLDRLGDVTMVPYRWASMPYLLWHDRQASIRNGQALADHLARQGVLWLPKHMNFINLSHTDIEIERFAAAVASFLTNTAES